MLTTSSSSASQLALNAAPPRRSRATNWTPMCRNRSPSAVDAQLAPSTATGRPPPAPRSSSPAPALVSALASRQTTRCSAERNSSGRAAKSASIRRSGRAVARPALSQASAAGSSGFRPAEKRSRLASALVGAGPLGTRPVGTAPVGRLVADTVQTTPAARVRPASTASAGSATTCR